MSHVFKLTKSKILSEKFAKKVKKARKISCIIFAVVFMTQLLPVSFNGLASGPRDCDTNAVIYCGTWSKKELIDKINLGDGRYSGAGLKTLFASLGIYTEDINSERTLYNGKVWKNGNVTLDGKVVATGVLSGGRHNLTGSTFWKGLYWRSPSVSFVSDGLDAFVYMDGSQFGYAIIKSCGNPVLKRLAPLTPTLTIHKMVQNETRDPVWRDENTAQPTDTLKYSVQVKSVGMVSSLDTVIWDVLPQKATLISGSGQTTVTGRVTRASVSDSQITGGLKVGLLSPGQDAFLVFKVKVAQASSFPQGTTSLVNTGFTKSANFSQIKDTAQTTVTIAPPPPPAKGAIKVIKFEDKDHDGQRDSDEPFVSGFKFKVNSTTMVTDANGIAIFSDLAAGTYTVTEVDFDRNVWIPTTGESQQVTVKAGETTQVMFGNQKITLPPAKGGIKVLKFEDINHNAQRDEGEPLIPGFKFKVDSTTKVTDQNGIALFSDLVAGNYTVTEIEFDKNVWIPTTGESQQAVVKAGEIVVLMFGNQKIVPPPPGPPIKVLAKSAFNVTQDIDATKVKTKAGDTIIYTLEVENKGETDLKDFVITDDISDVLEYANIIESDGGTVKDGVITYPKVDISAGQKVIKNFKVKVKDPIPDQPQSGKSFDFLMENEYGNKVTIEVEKPSIIPKPVILGVQEAVKLAPTGVSGWTLLALMLFMLASSVFLYAREKVLLVNALRSL